MAAISAAKRAPNGISLVIKLRQYFLHLLGRFSRHSSLIASKASKASLYFEFIGKA